jgi:glycyl-tRNA synthetase
MAIVQKFYLDVLKFPKDRFRFRQLSDEEKAFYNKYHWDVELDLSIGWKEVIGNAYRRDHDLRAHMNSSQKDLSYDLEGTKIIPHVIEPSFGIDRILYCILEHTYHPKDEARDWTWFAFPPSLAPFDAVILPLLNKPELEEKAHDLYTRCKAKGLSVLYDDSGHIGRRYARSDEIGIPAAITIDHQTLEDQTVTLRSRDTTEQTRHSAQEIPDLLLDLRSQSLSR